MHLYNAWLPPPVAEESKREKLAFAGVVRSVKELYNPDDPESVYATLKWVSVLDLFIKAKSELSVEDVSAIVEIGMKLFQISENKLHAQVRWGNFLVRLLNKYRKKLSLKVQWGPLYEVLVHTHFTRNTGPEGWRLRQRHFETVTSLVRSCRRFFPSGSALEIWSEFRSLMENPWHNASFEGAGFLRLFLPTNIENKDFFQREWVGICLDHWGSIPNCQFWNSQWASVTARVIKSYRFINWEDFTPVLFNIYLNMFEVPVANGSGSCPFSVDVPRNTRFLFANRTGTPSKAVAKSIVYLLKPGSLAQKHFDNLVNLLEQYYHPSNGGRWTYSLERFLFHLVNLFQKRLHQEQLSKDASEQSELFITQVDKVSFVNTVLKLIDRGQYSKNEQLSETVSAATSILSYIEPSLVLPFLVSRFHMALETMTATHQLKSAVTSIAFAGRAMFLSSLSPLDVNSTSVSGPDSYADLLMVALSNTLLGMDANDPPKTLATMQLIGSLFSSMSTLKDNMNGASLIPSIRFSEWLDEFLCRLFSLLQHLEPSGVLNEGIYSPASSGTFLVEDGPYYFCMLEIMLGRLSDSLYKQALKKISKFVATNILPGAIAEVGLLCCACVHANPQEAVVQLVKPILESVMSSLKATPATGFGSGATSTALSSSSKVKGTLSPALETAIVYQLKVLSAAICYGGPVLLHYEEQFKEVIVSAFDSTSWKVNGAGDHVLRSLLGSLVHYYPMDQYKCVSSYSFATSLEEWIDTKDFSLDKPPKSSKWHVPTKEEIQFANELLKMHFENAMDDLLTICQSKMHSDAGEEKDHLKVTLLRVDSSLQGVLSCLPDFEPSYRNGMGNDAGSVHFFIAGATGSCIGSSELRQTAADVIHETCKYLLKEKSDDSILLLLVIRIMDTLGNYGSSEYEEWSNHKKTWKLESTAIVEPPINFILSSHSKGKRRPRWALIDKAYMHNTWRSSQSSYHLYRTSGNIFPSDHLTLLMGDLLKLALHNYETVRGMATKCVLKMMKRWPSTISNCVLTLSENLRNPSSPENAVLGSCAILSSQTVLKRLTDIKALSSFLCGILFSSHHESLKAQKAITELFVKYNIYYPGVSRSISRATGSHADGTDFTDLITEIGSMSFESSNLHWRYNLMANRVLLLLAMASRNDPNSSIEVLSEITGHFLKNLKSHLPQTRILAISALNTLLKESPYKLPEQNINVTGELQRDAKSSLEGALTDIFQEEGFFNETLNSLSHVHIFTDADGASSRGNYGNTSLQSFADKSITRFYFDFSAAWPRTPSWISLFGSDTFYSSFARIFKRLIQECGLPVLLALKSSLVDFADAKERSKQCVAAEAFAGVLHADVSGISEAWDSWMEVKLQNIIHAPSVESIPEWAASIRYAVTGKGKSGTRIPRLRHQVIGCLMKPLPQTVSTSVVSKRYTFLSAAFIEVSPPRMPELEVQMHYELVNELLRNMSHSSAQVRESVGVTLAILCSNLRLHATFGNDHLHNVGATCADIGVAESWDQFLVKHASELVASIQNLNALEALVIPTKKISENGTSDDHSKDDIKWMETLFHFMISSLKSGRSSVLLDVIVQLLFPVVSLQETSNKDLSNLAKAAFELLKWRVFGEPHLRKAVPIILSLAEDPNWRTRSATLTFLRSFMYRHTFILSNTDKQQIWQTIEKLLTDNQVEVREHAAAVLAGLMKGGDEYLVDDFRSRAYGQANLVLNKRKQRSKVSAVPIASIHGSILALAACALSVPYDMPSWLPDHVTLLAHFVSEPSPMKSTVTKAIAEFRRTHADTWNNQKDVFTEEQLEVLADTSSSSSYFA